MTTPIRWAPAVILTVGVLMTRGIALPTGRPLRTSLEEAIPEQLGGFAGRSHQISEAERRVAGVTDYLFRSYVPTTNAAWGSGSFSVYVGYYDRQVAGETIHSPRNCLPGSGWEALQSSTAIIPAEAGPFMVNRYLIQKGAQQALVLYWYQGRGRIQSNEYAVKWNLLRDASLRGRSEEALVRIVVPLDSGADAALATATGAAADIARRLTDALPS